jgi:hypothetical protein
MKTMSVTQYAAMMGITRQAVLKRIGKSELPGVIKFEMVGSTYILTVDEKKAKNK